MADIPQLKGKTAVVTGANSGLGLEVARGLASKGAHVILAVRSIERGQAAAAAVLRTTPGAALEVMQLDLAELASVHRFAQALRSRSYALDLLINNAGVASTTMERTGDGFELVFGTNHLGHFALTGLLLPAILAAPEARVVTVTSLAHRSGQIDFDNLDGSRGYSPTGSYSQSKLANVLFGYELQRRLSAACADQLSVACHPGWAATNMTVGTSDRNARFQERLLRALARRLAPTAAQGALPIIYAATSPDARGADFIGPGGLFTVWGGPARARSSARSYDLDLARRLWQVSEEMTGVQYSFAATQPVEVNQKVDAALHPLTVDSG